ncbi:helix-turn-helix transcriptional regulator [Rhizobium calliandrae]|uniref:Helix-turn-helix transcriptional regulator n=1 Tax=Rhizobium calliandrae TaxID=1312182 RepID=A0ABT7KQA8_9HYPH|nr:helix-turn-helix transcriptional regulator [Rhizobium calliandrae]MDL2410833.1 helix-turn-helix transcriptional regulator [Rhizobium calliandrae]
MNLSQRAAAEAAGVPHRYLSIVESSASRISTNLELVDFYAAAGIELLGEASIGNEVTRAGARWSAPNSPDISKAVKATFHVEDTRVSFRAARALLNKKQDEIAELTGLSRATVKSLESGKAWQESHQTLLTFYERSGVEFVGWGDPVTNRYFGIGVRWSPNSSGPEFVSNPARP